MHAVIGRRLVVSTLLLVAMGAETCFVEVCDCASQPTVDDVEPFVGCENGMCLAIWPLE